MNLALVNPAKLAVKITDRHKVEREAFEKFAAVYGDEDGEAYKPSPGLLLWCARCRQLLDGEVTWISLPSAHGTLAGVVTFPEA